MTLGKRETAGTKTAIWRRREYGEDDWKKWSADLQDRYYDAYDEWDYAAQLV